MHAEVRLQAAAGVLDGPLRAVLGAGGCVIGLVRIFLQLARDDQQLAVLRGRVGGVLEFFRVGNLRLDFPRTPAFVRTSTRARGASEILRISSHRRGKK
jgi:predicted membrane metal-binding protein